MSRVNTGDRGGPAAQGGVARQRLTGEARRGVEAALAEVTAAAKQRGARARRDLTAAGKADD